MGGQLTLNWATGWQEVGQQQDPSVNTEPKSGLGSVGTEPRDWRGHWERVGLGWEPLSSRGLWAGGRLVGGTGPGVEARLGCLSPQEGAGHRPVVGHRAWAGMNSRPKAGWGHWLPRPQARTEAPDGPKD